MDGFRRTGTDRLVSSRLGLGLGLSLGLGLGLLFSATREFACLGPHVRPARKGRGGADEVR